MFCGLGYLKGAHPPGIQNDVPKYFQATHYVFYAHAKTVAVYKQLKQYGEIGITHVFYQLIVWMIKRKYTSSKSRE